MKKKNLYEVLEVSTNASPEDIRKSYKSLALKYHPDKNPSPEASDKFREIAEAYAILSDKDKKKMYDLTGTDMDDENDYFGMGEGIDPFNVFNSIFQQHINQFMNMKYERDVDLNQLFEKISGPNVSLPFGTSLPGVKIQVHTFPMGMGMGMGSFFPVSSSSFTNDDMNFIREEYVMGGDSDESDEDIDGVPNLFSELFRRAEKEENKNRKTKKEKKEKQKQQKIKNVIMREKPDDIILNIKVSLKDILNKDLKTIHFDRMRKKDNEYKMKKRKIEIPIYAKEILLEEDGHEEENCSKKGDVIIHIEMANENNFRRIHEYDLFTVITSNNPLITLPNDETFKIKVDNENEGCLFKISGKGIPHEDDERGNLYVFIEKGERGDIEIKDDEMEEVEWEKVNMFELFDD